MNIAEIILMHGESSTPAVFYKDAAMTYGELRQKIDLFGRSFSARGCKMGDRIGIFSENNPFFVTAYFASLRAGMIAVPLPTDLTEKAFGKIISSARIHEMFVSKRFFNRIYPWVEKLSLHLLVEGGEASWIVKEPGYDASISKFSTESPPSLIAALMFTSGSDGMPKGVMVTHRNIECNTRDIISYMNLSSNDRVMVVLPFYYCFGMSLLHSVLMAGGSLVLNDDFKLFPEKMLQEMLAANCTGFAGVPSTYQILLRKSRFKEMKFPTLRWFQQAGGKLPNACIQELRVSFPDIKYFLMYGQTEATARLSYLPPELLDNKLGSIGKGLPSTRLEVLKPDGTPVMPGSNETGEIVASGDNITPGYWNEPVETAKYFKNGKLHTGDIARMDRDGFIFVVEREREMIKTGGHRVSAKEIEEVIAEIPEVVEVAVIGSPHNLLGECITAFVVLVSNATTDINHINRHCWKRLPSFKVPEEIFFLEQMPYNGSGKICKRILKEMAAFSPDELLPKTEAARIEEINRIVNL